MDFKPLQDHVLVAPRPLETMSAGGIIIPQNNNEKPTEGKVIAVGPGYTNTKGETIPLEVKEGDQILFSKYTGTEIKIDNKEYIVIKEDNILGVLDNN